MMIKRDSLPSQLSRCNPALKKNCFIALQVINKKAHDGAPGVVVDDSTGGVSVLCGEEGRRQGVKKSSGGRGLVEGRTK